MNLGANMNESSGKIRAFVDFSIFCHSASYGRISGIIHLPITPVVGDLMSFASSKIEVEKSVPEHIVSIVHRPLKVDGRFIYVEPGDCDISLQLEAIAIDDWGDGILVMNYFESAHHLMGDPFE